MSALIDKTFPMRRKAILDKPRDLDSLFKDYPFLRDGEQVRYNEIHMGTFFHLCLLLTYIAFERVGENCPV